MNASFGQSPRKRSGMNLCGSFQYRAVKRHQNQSPLTQSQRRTIVMQARNMKFDLRPRRDRECCLTTINSTHCQGGILRSDLWDARYLIIIVHRWNLVRTHSNKHTGGLWVGCKFCHCSGAVTQSNRAHNSLRVS